MPRLLSALCNPFALCALALAFLAVTLTGPIVPAMAAEPIEMAPDPVDAPDPTLNKVPGAAAPDPIHMAPVPVGASDAILIGVRSDPLLLGGPAITASDARVTGAVEREFVITDSELAKHPPVVRPVKWHNAQGELRNALFLRGVSLARVLEGAKIKKKSDDGFNRELDMFIVVRSGQGLPTVFSYGEIMLARDPDAFVLAPDARFVMPGHHEDISKTKYGTQTWLKERERAKPATLATCQACHGGAAGQPPTLSLPQRTLLAGTLDRDYTRCIDTIKTIEVCQCPPTGDASPAAKIDKDKMFVDAPDLVLPDGKTEKLTASAVQGLPRTTCTTESVGMGKGFRGKHVWQGHNLAEVLRPRLPQGTDMRSTYVLITAADGYRSLLSACEIFNAPNECNVLLVDLEDGKPLAEGQGRFKVIVAGDFFIDRAVRAVREIRVVTVK